MKKKCETKFCRNKCKTKYCNTCKTRKWRKQNVERSSYLNLKHNSKRRNIEFNLSFDDFLEFAYKHKYFSGKGKFSWSLSIDRKDSKKGYIKENLQILTLAENSSKMHLDKRLNYDYENKEAWVTSSYELQKLTNNLETDKDLPF